jgi:hypothetical protein
MQASPSKRLLMLKRANTHAKVRTSVRVRAAARPATTVAKARTLAKARGAAPVRGADQPVHRPVLQRQAEIRASRASVRNCLRIRHLCQEPVYRFLESRTDCRVPILPHFSVSRILNPLPIGRALFVRKLSEITFVRFVYRCVFFPLRMQDFLRHLSCDLEVKAAQILESADEGFNQAEVPELKRVLSSRWS